MNFLVSLSEMEAATSTFQHSFGLGPRGPNPPYGAQQAQGPHQPGPGPSGPPHPEEQQQQHKPFFYMQPTQPYMPMQSMQWPVPVPMPVSYNPYYGFPGLGKWQCCSLKILTLGCMYNHCLIRPLCCVYCIHSLNSHISRSFIYKNFYWGDPPVVLIWIMFCSVI